MMKSHITKEFIMTLISVKATGSSSKVWINPANIARIEMHNNTTVIHFMHGELKHLTVDGDPQWLVNEVSNKGEQVYSN
jgi:hypothetical protein